MNSKQPKKKFVLTSKISVQKSKELNQFVYDFTDYFKVYNFQHTNTALKYIQGLMVSEKGHGNMERMEEYIPDSEYRLYQNFISNSNWDADNVLKKVAIDTSTIMQDIKTQRGNPVMYIIDESAHLKKGKYSVGVAKQYAGVAGKVDNAQVGVYSCLCCENRTTLINERLFLPQSWIDDKQRCDKAGVPYDKRVFKTKPQLALEMIDQDVNRDIRFDCIAGDGLYGHSFELTDGLDERELFYVLDVHKDEKVFLEEPQLIIPERKGKKGPYPKLPKPDKDSVRLDQYVCSLKTDVWEKVKVRKTAKGWKKVLIHTRTIWVYDPNSQKIKKRLLIITRETGKKPRTKYSFSNGDIDQYCLKEYAYFQGQRYWVERCFDDAKNELCMSDYQIRKWLGWHHHHALVFMASLYLMKQKINAEPEYPLMSVRDARILIITMLFGTNHQVEIAFMHMQERHRKRQADIDRYYLEHPEEFDCEIKNNTD